MKNRFFVLSAFFLIWAAAASLPALEPNRSDLFLKERWLAAKFQCQEPVAADGIEIVQNYDPPRRNYGLNAAIRIGGETFAGGIFCHAPSDLIVHLPSPGESFHAVVGVDNNKRNDEGTVVFSVEVNGKTVFDSGLKRGGEEGVPVDVALDGAAEFHLKVSEYGDGISCDQSDWADARVLLKNGETIALGEMIFYGESGKTYESGFPFSFVYDGRSSRDFLADWPCAVEESGPNGGKKTKTFTFTDPDGLLQVRCVMIDYVDFPNVEWTLYFKNIGDRPTKTLEQVNAADFWIAPQPGCDITLHHAYGSVCNRLDYTPRTTVLKENESYRMAGTRGRPSDEHWPYFNIATGPSGGMIVVVGWPGQWAADLNRTPDGLNVAAGQETLHVALQPGEEVRSPRMLVQPWRHADWLDAQNVWRAFMIRHCIPRNADGVPYSSQIGGCSSHQFKEMAEADAASQIYFTDRYIGEKVRLDYWWMDAGWYECNDSKEPWQWVKTGSWWPEKSRFPNGLREVTDHLRSLGRYNVVWFEPERVAPDTWLTKNHPEWIANGKEGGLLNLANPETVDWAIETFSRIIQEQGIELYRQDFNIEPLGAWQKWDGDDPLRQGFTENRHVVGYLRYWDELLKRNPGLRLDSCASGGKRNEFEAMTRAVPLHRSDFLMDPIGQQSHSYGLFLWLPMFGSCINTQDDYVFRGCMMPGINLLFDMRKTDVDYSRLRRNIKIWEESLAPYYLGDYYPLTEPSDQDDRWLGWQFYSPEKEAGVIQMFRRAESPVYIQGGFPLRGLDRNASYRFNNVDTGEKWTVPGAELLDRGVVLKIEERSTAAIFTYEKVAP